MLKKRAIPSKWNLRNLWPMGGSCTQSASDESYLVDNMTSLNTVPIKKKKAPSDGDFMVT